MIFDYFAASKFKIIEDYKMKQGAERYSDKTEDYAKYRPGFPTELIDYFYENCNMDNSSIIADIGSGTGRFTRLLLERSNLVYGVEQNNEMRIKAEELLSQYTNFTSIKGSAEATSLADQSVDVITVAQAFHWFDKEKSIKEFKRILKNDGKVFLVWDDFIDDYNELSIEFGKVTNAFRNGIPETKIKKLTRNEMIDGLFKGNNYKTISFVHELHQGFDGMKGGALSASFAPRPGEDNYEDFLIELRKVFDKYQQNGVVCNAFRSVCFLGELE
jgi:ubiquinone/menaquinone biosynthesis C-methylase UbiE